MKDSDSEQVRIGPMEPGDIYEALAIQAQAYPAWLREDGPGDKNHFRSPGSGAFEFLPPYF